MSKMDKIDRFDSGRPWEGDHDAFRSEELPYVRSPDASKPFLSRWRMRARSRAALYALDDRLLQDIGLTRDDALKEARKPFWKA